MCSLENPHTALTAPVVYTCTSAIIPAKTNGQKSPGMSVQAATSAPKPLRGCCSCILAPNRLRGQRGIYSHYQGPRKINQQNLLPRGLRQRVPASNTLAQKSCKVRALSHTTHSSRAFLPCIPERAMGSVCQPAPAGSISHQQRINSHFTAQTDRWFIASRLLRLAKRFITLLNGTVFLKQ